MIDLNVLKTEVSLDPETLQYTGDDVQDAKILNDNSLGRKMLKEVVAHEVVSYLAKQINGTDSDKRYVLDLMIEFANNGTVRGIPPVGLVDSDVKRSGTRMILMVLKIPNAVFDVNDINIKKAFQDLSNGAGEPAILNNVILSGLKDLAKRSCSRAEELFGTAVTPSDIADARRM